MGEPPGSIRDIGGGWGRPIADRLGSEQVRRIDDFLAALDEAAVCPPRNLVFAAFEATPLDCVRAVILGQDPYPSRDQACGLAFSVPASLPEGVRRPPSLGRILAEVGRGGFAAAPRATLKSWTSHVLLLNSSLTFEKGKADKHRAVWRPFTDAVIELLVETSDAVFLLWGVWAQEFGRRLKIPAERMVCSPHPMARGRAAPFAGSHPFRRANLLLPADRQIDWTVR